MSGIEITNENLKEWDELLLWDDYGPKELSTVFNGLNQAQIQALVSIRRAMEYGAICQHDDDFLCIHRMQFIADELKKLNE